MAYQNVGTPRFYIDIFSWLKSLGLAEEGSYSNFGLNTSGQTDMTTRSINLTGGTPMILDYFAVLGHELGGHPFNGGFGGESVAGDYHISNYTPTEVINCEGGVGEDGGDVYTPTYHGFSIVRFTQVDILDNNIEYFYYASDNDTDFNSSTFSLGKTYQMPHSPDLSLTLGYETGTKTIETRGGASLSNTMWRPPMWGSLGAWELSDPGSPTPNQTLAHSSRRTWSLSFSFLDKTNTFPKYNALNRYTNEDLSDSDLLLTEGETLLTSDDFFSQVWNRVGTALPYIFQPDKDVPEFAICKFTNNFSFQQTAPGLFSCKIRLKEVW